MRIKFFLAFLVICLCSKANEIDQLQTDHEVQTFLYKLETHFSYKYDSLKVLSTADLLNKTSCDSLFQKWNIKVEAACRYHHQ